MVRSLLCLNRTGSWPKCSNTATQFLYSNEDPVSRWGGWMPTNIAKRFWAAIVEAAHLSGRQQVQTWPASASCVIARGVWAHLNAGPEEASAFPHLGHRLSFTPALPDVGAPSNTPTSPQTMSHRQGKKPTQPVVSSGSAKPNDQKKVVPHVYRDPKLKPPANGRPPSFQSFPSGTEFSLKNTRPNGEDIIIGAGKVKSDVRAASGSSPPGASGYPHEFKNVENHRWLIRRGNEANVKLREIPIDNGPPYNCNQRRTKPPPPARALFTVPDKTLVHVVYHPQGSARGELVPATAMLGRSSESPAQAKQKSRK